MTEIQEICRVAGANYPDMSVATPNEEVLDDLHDLSLLSRMLHLAIEATGTPDAEGTITYYGSQLTRGEFPQAYEQYIAIHSAVPEWTATKKIQGTIAALAIQLSPESRTALNVPSITAAPSNTSRIESWLNTLFGNAGAMTWINTTLTQESIQARIAAPGVSQNDRTLLQNLLKLVQMRDIAQEATGSPTAVDSMTGLGCQLSGANPQFCPSAPTPDTEGTFDIYMNIHSANPNYTATSKVRRTITSLVETLPQNIKTDLGITGSVSDWISGIRTLEQAQNLLDRVNAEIVERCGTLNAGIVSINPTQVQQGQTIILTVNGINFPADSRVQFYLGQEEDSSITVNGNPTVAANGNPLTVEITVGPNASTTAARTIRLYSQADATYEARFVDALTITTSAPAVPATCTNELDDDHDGSIDDADSDCQVGTDNTIAGEQDLTGEANASYILNNVFGMRGIVGLGYGSGAPENAPYQLRSPIISGNPNLRLNLDLDDVTIVGGPNTEANLGENPLITTSQDLFRLYGDFNGYYQTYFQEGGDATDHEGRVALSLTPRIRPWGSNSFYIDANGSIAYGGASRTNPTLMYFDGSETMVTAGGALGTNFGQRELELALFGGYRHNWFDLNRETSGLYELDGQRRGGFAGLRFNADLYRALDNNAAPDLRFQLQYGWGSTYDPVYINGQTSHDLEDQQIITGQLAGYWTVPDINPFALISFASLSQRPEEAEDWENNMWQLQISGGVDSSIGYIAGGYGHVENVGLYDNAGNQDGAFLMYALPRSLRGWSGLMLRGDINSYNGNVAGGAMLMYDLFRGIWPNPPQDVHGPIPTTNNTLPWLMQ